MRGQISLNEVAFSVTCTCYEYIKDGARIGYEESIVCQPKNVGISIPLHHKYDGGTLKWNKSH